MLNLFSFRNLLINYKIKIDPNVEIYSLDFTREPLSQSDNSRFHSAIIEIILRLNFKFPMIIAE